MLSSKVGFCLWRLRCSEGARENPCWGEVRGTVKYLGSNPPSPPVGNHVSFPHPKPSSQGCCNVKTSCGRAKNSILAWSEKRLANQGNQVGKCPRGLRLCCFHELSNSFLWPSYLNRHRRMVEASSKIVSAEANRRRINPFHKN